MRIAAILIALLTAGLLTAAPRTQIKGMPGVDTVVVPVRAPTMPNVSNNLTLAFSQVPTNAAAYQDAVLDILVQLWQLTHEHSGVPGTYVDLGAGTRQDAIYRLLIHLWHLTNESNTVGSASLPTNQPALQNIAAATPEAQPRLTADQILRLLVDLDAAATQQAALAGLPAITQLAGESNLINRYYIKYPPLVSVADPMLPFVEFRVESPLERLYSKAVMALTRHDTNTYLRIRAEYWRLQEAARARSTNMLIHTRSTQ